jgi:hypothetical protein
MRLPWSALLLLACLPCWQRQGGTSRAWAQAATSSTVPVGTVAHHKIYSASSPINTLAGIVTDVGANPITATLYGTIGYGAILTVPSTLTLDLTQGIIDCNNVAGAVTILGPIQAPAEQKIFANCGTSGIEFGAQVHEIYPMWWDLAHNADAVQAAVNAAPIALTDSNTGARVVLPAGSYAVNALSIARNSLTLEGQGSTMTKLVSQVNDGSTPGITIANAAALIGDVNLKHFRLTAVSANSTGDGVLLGRSGGALTDVFRTKFIDLYVDGFDGAGVHCRHCEYALVENSIVQANGSHGLYFDGEAGGGSGFNTIINTRAVSNLGYNIFFNNTSSNTCIQCEALVAPASGVNVQVTNSTNNVFIGLDTEVPATAKGIVFTGNGLHTVIDGFFATLAVGVDIGVGFVTNPIYMVNPRIAGNVTTPINVQASSALFYQGADIPMTVGANAVVQRMTPNGVVPLPLTPQTIAAGNTVIANACGGLKRVTAVGAVTTSTSDTFTAPAASNAGCQMTVCNVGAQNITLDNNANFKSAGGVDVVLTPDDCVVVVSTGVAGVWYQVSALLAN